MHWPIRRLRSRSPRYISQSLSSLHLAVAVLAASWLATSSSGTHAAPVAGVVWQHPIEVAKGAGVRGPWQQNDSRYDYVDDPTPVIDAQGTITVAWVDEVRKDVFLQRFASNGKPQFNQPVNVSRSPASFSWLPRMVIDDTAPDRLFILWQEIIFSGGAHGGDMYFARSEDGGATFSPGINMTESVAGEGKGRITRDVWHNGSYDLALAPDGTLHAAWTDYDGQLRTVRSTDGGKTFSPSRHVAGTRERPARGPSLAAGRDGSVYLAWTTGEDDGADIHVARSVDGGLQFSSPLLVAPSPTYSDAPQLALDSDGTLHLAYAESRGGFFDRFRIRYARSTDGARSFELPRDVSLPLSQQGESAGFPALAVDARGWVYVMWESYEDTRQRPRGLGMAVSPDGGRRFSEPAIVPGSVDPGGGGNGSYQGLLMQKLAVNRSGMVAAVNSSLVQGQRSRVWLLRGRPQN